jgi:Ca-activated chloride channel family protein
MQGVNHKLKNRTMLKSLILCVLLGASFAMNAQTDKKYIRKGNREYEKSKFPESEISYRKAIDNNKQYPDAGFNVGDALYKQNKFEEAAKQFTDNVNQNEDKLRKSSGYYNLGNSLLKANKFPESIDAYKSSLKLNPNNREAKYNLSYAQDLLKKQQEQQKQQQDKDKQNQKNDKNKQDQKKDQNDQKDQKDNNSDQKKDQNDKQDQKQQQQPQKQEISKDDAQRLLNSLANDEKNVQEKVKLAKANKSKIRTVKNW